MPIQSTDLTSMLFISNDSETWVIKPNVVILNHGATAIWSIAQTTVVINNGTITGGAGVDFRGSNSKLHNADRATIFSEVGEGVQFLGGGKNTLTNEGSIYSPTTGVFAAFTSQNDTDSLTIENIGTIESGDVGIHLRSDSSKASLIDNSGSIIADGVAINLGMPNGMTRVVNTGTIEAGPNLPAIVVASSGQLEVVNFGLIIGDVSASDPGATSLIASEDVIRNGGEIYGDVTLGPGNDRYEGAGGMVSGVIDGGSGRDKLGGGSAADTLHGGLDKDRLKGGGDADTFLYSEIADSRPGARDVILDFRSRQSDVIDLSAIDAQSGAGNQGFSFVGASTFSGAKGELRYDATGRGVIVEADRNGDGKADFSVLLAGLKQVNAGDFTL